MSDKNLIDDLVSKHEKVKPVESVRMRALKWLITCFLCLAAGIAILGIREDWQMVFQNPLMLMQNLLILTSVLITGVFAIRLSQPASLSTKKGKLSLIIPALLWVGLLITQGLTHGFSISEIQTIHVGCIKDIIIIGLIPGITLFISIYHGVVLNKKLTGTLAMIASFGVGAWAVQFTCHNDDPLHVFAWHFLPLVSLGLLGVFVGKKIFNKI